MTKLVIFSFLGFIVLIATGVGFFILGKSVKNNSSIIPQVQETPQPTPVPTTGFIQGSLSYPSEGIPPNLQVCVETLQYQQVKCVEGGSGSYSIEVAPGSYYIYAVIPDNPSLKAYYSEFVTCGLLASCPSHDPIEIPVMAGESVLDINPGDWYNTQ